MFKHFAFCFVLLFTICTAHAGVCGQFSRYDLNVLVGTQPDASCIDALTSTSIALRPDGSVDIVLFKDKAGWHG
jgi:hypothetical protein